MAEATLQLVSPKKIFVNPLNPRKDLGDLDAMQKSIVSLFNAPGNGLIQPLKVRPVDDKFEIIAGERRFTAINQAIAAKELPKSFLVPIIAEDVDDETAVQMMFIENLMREGLSDHEQAAGFKTYLNKYPDNPEAIDELALKTGFDVRFIRRRVKVLDLPVEVLDMWQKGNLSYGHLEQLLRLSEADAIATANGIMNNNCSVAELKENIDRMQTYLSKALFDKKECGKCQYSSKVQAGLFGDDFKSDKIKCMDPACFHNKQVAYLNEHWNELPDVKKYKTNGIVISGSYGATNASHKAPAASCKKCDKFVTQIYESGESYHDHACNGDPACFKKNYMSIASSNNNTEPLTEEKIKEEKLEKRAENIGKEFAEIFYKERLPGMLQSDHFSLENLRALLLAMINTNKNFMFPAINKRDNWNEYSSEITKLRQHVFEMTPSEIMEHLSTMTGAILLSFNTSLSDRIEVAKSFGLCLENEFIMTEDYLKKKTKDQLIDMNDQFKILPDFGRTGLSPLKKTEIVKRFLEKDLTGMIPDEVKAVAAGKPEPIIDDVENDDETVDEAVNQ